MERAPWSLQDVQARFSAVVVVLPDTLVVSKFRKARPDPEAVAWRRGLPESDVCLSVVTLGDIERGIAKSPDAEFAATSARWLDDLLRFHGDRALPMTADIARRWGPWPAEVEHDGADLPIAATAAARRLTVATRDVRHFAPTGVAVVDPFERSR